MKVINKVKPKIGVKEALEIFKSKNIQIIIVTARDDNYFKEGATNISEQFLKKYNITYDKLITNTKDKARVCIDNNIDIFIDDSVKTCLEIENAGIKALLFTSLLNKNSDAKIERVSSWDEIINKIIN